MVAYNRLQAVFRDEIDLAAEDGFEFLLQAHEGEQAVADAGLELDQDVDIAVAPEIVAGDRAEKGKLLDAVAMAEVVENVSRGKIDWKSGSCHPLRVAPLDNRTGGRVRIG